jgi:isoquinoline 1-oxidoreductase beta subunit
MLFINIQKEISLRRIGEEASKLEMPKTVALKKIEDYKILRKPVPRQDTPLKTNGTAIFGMDKKTSWHALCSHRKKSTICG